ncbi:hypothetical protein BDF14DRAFT_1733090 [Spinellus fusiger]|nr:hypothetical protein BDF14DRAFT_1733090 [Spinellus fusiger]
MPPELILNILRHITNTTDLLSCALTCKQWTFHALELLWSKPAVTDLKSWNQVCTVLNNSTPLFPYRCFIRRINLTHLTHAVMDPHLVFLSNCERIERLTLAGCSSLTDQGLLALLNHGACSFLVSMDLSDVPLISDLTLTRIAEQCPKLQGLNLSMSREGQDQLSLITDSSIVKVAHHCRGLKRIKIHYRALVTDVSALALAEHCPGLTEIDLMNCGITNTALVAIFQQCRDLKEFRVNQCVQLSLSAFLQSFPLTSLGKNSYEQLRLLDLTGVLMLTDSAVQHIVWAAPRLRNVILNKCCNLTDASVLALCGLGRHLHYLHLGHCSQLTDHSILHLAKHCTRLRYLDLANCSQLTDTSVTELATLPKLKRIGLVKCTNITDEFMYALTTHVGVATTLERVHLSYCSRLSVHAVMHLVHFCHRLTHLSLTHVPAFLHTGLQRFCRAPPREFTEPQRRVFCVFSGKGVYDLRRYFQTLSEVERDHLYPPLTLHRLLPHEGPLSLPYTDTF